MAKSTIQSLPTIWPTRKSSEPKASQRNTIESTTSPRILEATTAKAGGNRRAGDDRGNAEFYAQSALNKVPQHQSNADHQHAGRRHQAGRHRQQARAVGRANRSNVADHPIGQRNGQAEQDQKKPAFNVLLLF
jgi:hypothetical protein